MLLRLFLFLSIVPFSAFAQKLSLNEALAICLVKNYDIVLAKNDSATAHKNNTIGNAGMLPNLTANAGVNYGLGNLNQQFVNGTEINRNNVNSINANVSANLNWTLFDGLRMFFLKKQLSMQESFATLQLKDKVQNSIASVITAYYEVVKQQQTILAFKEAIRLAEERYKIANTKVELGVSAKTDALQAKVDVNARRAELLKQQAQLDNVKQVFNLLLARNIETPFEVEDSIPFSTQLSAQTLQAINNNFAIQSAMLQAGIAQQQLKETQARRSPVIVANAAYNYSYSRSDAGFSLFNQQNGLVVGATLSFPVFNGFNLNREVKIAKINVQKSETTLEQLKMQTTLQQKKAARDFTIAQQALNLENENILLARENVLIATERFKLSQSTAVEFREAQKSYEDALLRLVAARYEVKKAETELFRLSGKLVQ